MTKKTDYLYLYYKNNSGVPARKLAVGLFAHSPRQSRKTRLPAGYPLQSLTRRNSYSYDSQEIFLY